jgi:hypothetical protein
MIRGLVFIVTISCVFFMASAAFAGETVGIWMRFEQTFTSAKTYENPLYNVKSFTAAFTSPSGRTLTRSGFWDGGTTWKVRFMPDETGTWRYTTTCSDKENTGLHGIEGSIECVTTKSPHDIYTKGAIIRPKGFYHLSHADGAPFFWLGDTAWNGPLKSTEKEWERYLTKRADQGYTVIQFVTTQWRGGDMDKNGMVAFEGCGHININPDYFKRLDTKIDRINDHGLVAGPVLLWALHFVTGRHLSPGYYLPQDEAALLAKYMVARYGAHHVVWILGGDGKFVDEYEQRWKNIGRAVFGEQMHPGVVTTHPMGLSWYGAVYDDEDWLDIVGYQSSHSTARRTVEFITRGPAAKEWDKLPPRPVLNMEPIYDNIRPNATVRDIRNACWWSILATPVAGITYGANGIWSWLREGEEILNHRNHPGIKRWHESLDFLSGEQAALLASFMRALDWTRLRPAQDILVTQPGDENYKHFVSVVSTDAYNVIIVYVPAPMNVEFTNPRGYSYTGQCFDPATGKYTPAIVSIKDNCLMIDSPGPEDMVLLLKREMR